MDESSPLYAKLCQADVNGDCTIPAKIVLDSNLIYDDVGKTGSEYSVDTIRTVKLMVGSKPIYYEYLKTPCVEHSYYRDAKRVIKGSISTNSVQQSNMCGSPLLESATPMCSDSQWPTLPMYGEIHCNYQGERTTFNTAQAVCEANGLEQSYPYYVLPWRAGPCHDGIQSSEFRSWAFHDCGLKVKVDFDSAQIAIVHSP